MTKEQVFRVLKTVALYQNGVEDVDEIKRKLADFDPGLALVNIDGISADAYETSEEEVEVLV